MNKKKGLLLVITIICLFIIVVLNMPSVPEFEIKKYNKNENQMDIGDIDNNYNDNIVMLDQEQFVKTILPTDETNNTIVISFLNDLLGNDYETIYHLLKDVPAEPPNDEFRKQIDKHVKNNRELQQYFIVNVTHLTDGISLFEVELSFSDGTVDLMELEIDNGKVSTPIEKLIKKHSIN